MALIDVQKLTNGRLLSNGSAAIGAAGDNDPTQSQQTVYIDYELTTAYRRADGQEGVQFGLDGLPVNFDGQRVSVYIGSDYSLQLFDSAGGQIQPDAMQIGLSAGGSLGFDGVASATTLGSVIGSKEAFDGNGDTLGFIPIYDSIT